MKTKITSILVLSVSVFSLNAQIPNASFENWTANEPNSWQTYNLAFPGAVTPSSDAHAGSAAARLNVISYFGTNIGGILFSGDPNTLYFPVSSPPVAIHGWYKFQPTVSTESIVISSLVQEMGVATAAGGGEFNSNTLVYTEFIVDYFYVGAPAADSAYIFISLSDPDSVRYGTYAIIDDLSFGPAGQTGVAELNNGNLLEPCYPNPSSQVANIIYRVEGRSKVSLSLYDMVGNEVKKLLDGLEQATGRYKVPTDIHDLADGIYFCKLNINENSYTQKLVVSKTDR